MSLLTLCQSPAVPSGQTTRISAWACVTQPKMPPAILPAGTAAAHEDFAAHHLLALLHFKPGANRIAVCTGLLTFSRNAARRSGNGQVRRAIETASAILKYGMSRSAIELHVNMPDEIPEVACSQSDLEQVFLNLLTNAREATPHGGRITVTVRSSTGSCEISIADTGCGISAENLPRVLEPFFTTKPHGNGLGLSICRSVLWEVDGTLTIQSVPGNGTDVRVLVPQAVSLPHPQRS